ncbi:hypothetical protein [Gemmobacter sp.]|uniref:hypothetical protein n=1 Tax=Gemmobacter sp. TaxID=1898957 RepID=UPI002AFDCEC3|nr:hypothetical protein [Gemmobacter sp.]
MSQRLISLLAGSVILLAAQLGNAEVTFPKTRNVVGDGEYYLLEDFGSWAAQCLKDKNAEDSCEAAILLEDLDAGLKFELAVAPYDSITPSKADVDVVPRAWISALPLFSSEHHNTYSVAITEIDGVPFDGFWCRLTDAADCYRGPEVAQSDLEILLAAKSARVSVFDSQSTPDSFHLIGDFDVDFRAFGPALDAALGFVGKTHGFDPSTVSIPTEMCTLEINGPFRAQKRISYTYDEDFDSEQTTLREIALGPKGRGNCPSYVSLAYLTPDMTIEQRKMFCLVHDKEKDVIAGFQRGAQNAYRICSKQGKSFCQKVNDSKDAALTIAGFGAGTVSGVAGTAVVTGTTVVSHSSGAWILTGSSGYIAGTLGTLGTTVMGILSAPVVVGAAAVSIVAVGGAVYACSE